jgi:homocysteine S-methyltransferase
MPEAVKLSLPDRLKKSVLVADGAMGTMVARLSPHAVECVESLVLTSPELIADIHRQYVRAGAMIIETNTFAANRRALARFRLEDKVGEINRQAVGLARRETGLAGIDGYVAGSIGPIRATVGSDALALTEDNCRAILADQLEHLLGEGVDCIIFETFGDSAELARAVRICKDMSAVAVIASMTASRSGTTVTGEPLRRAAEKVIDAGADVIGLNCGYGIRAIETALEHIAGLGVPVSVMPNAGFPEQSEGRLRFGASEEYMANEAVVLAQMGARIIGGCCGTTPSHIEAISKKLREKKIVVRQRVRHDIEITRDEGFKPGKLLAALEKIRLPIICEIDPPATLNTGKNIDAIRAVVEQGAGAISMADNPLATVKIENLAFACAVRSTLRVPLLLHVTARDRNLLALQSFMLGAHVNGIESLLCVTGDPSTQAGGPSNVYDVNSIGLIRMAAQLNAGKNLSGKDLGMQTDFSIGAAVNPNMADITPQLRHLKNKAAAGARFALTQPMYESAKVREFLEQARDIGIKIFVGIMPPISLRTAEYLHHEVPGISIPETLFARMRTSGDPAYQKQAGLEHAKQLVEEIAPMVDGLYLIAPHSQPSAIAEIVSFAAGLRK